MIMPNLKLTGLTAGLLLLLSACSGGSDDGKDGLNSLLSFSDESPGANCPYGGTQISAGLDVNGNGILDANEITSQDYLCVAAGAPFDGLVYRADYSIDGMFELRRTGRDQPSDSLIFAPFSALGEIISYELSPDKRHIAFRAKEQEPKTDLYLYTFNDGNPPVKATTVTNEFQTVQSFKWSPDSKRVAYRLNDTDAGRFELYSVLANGTGNVRLNGALIGGGTVRPEYEWAPDGHRIAYRASQDTLGRNELYTSLPDGKDNQKVSELTAFGNVEAFAWSPDSSQLLYVADQDTDGIREVYTTAADEADSVKINGSLAASGFVREAHWAPNGQRIAYRADQDVFERVELYTSQPDGSNNIRVSGTMTPNGDVSNIIKWAPDSSAIAYTADQIDDTKLELFLSRPDSSTGNIRLNGDLAGEFVINFYWSPDSRHLAYQAYEDSDSVLELYLVDLVDMANPAVQKAHPDYPDSSAGAFSVFWSPDSQHLAFIADANASGLYELFRVRPDGTEHQKVNDDPPNSFIPTASWSPDSQRIAYMADKTTASQFDLYSAAIDGSPSVRVSGQLVEEGSITSFSW
ncbi:MAG: hypothetical protein LAT65_09655 [Saccharospirillum sp.]|nr:hypothetical protein [Saccharospirillum sp.]